MDNRARNLRELAIEKLKSEQEINSYKSNLDLKTLIEELSIYQIELEHQNQELISSQNELQNSINRYIDLFDNAPIGYLIVDIDGVIKDINETACILFGSTKSQLKNIKISKLIQPDYQDIYYLYFKRLVSQKYSQTCDIKLQKSDNSFFFARIQGIRQLQLNVDIPEFRLAVIDISIQKEMELKLLLAKEKAEENDKLKSAFLANMSHEIRTPMNGILGFAELLRKPTLTENNRVEYINIIKKSSVRLLELINELIDISKIESGQMQIKLSTVNVFDTLNDVLSFLLPEAKSKNIDFVFDYSNINDPLNIETDKEKLYAIVLNLIKNALKYTNKGHIKIDCYYVDNKLKIYIRDTGIGIPEDKFDLVFKRFRQVEETGFHEGAGLGLSIVLGLLKLLGGDIRFASIVNKGSIFYFSLPCTIVKPILKNTVTNSNDLELDLSHVSILIAEDDYSSYYYATELLSNTNAKMSYVENGIQLMDYLNNAIPDLILLDINMPLKNGYECLKEIKQRNIKTKIIALTAYAMNDEKKLLFKFGCDGYISKPYTQCDLFVEIDKVLTDCLK